MSVQLKKEMIKKSMHCHGIPPTKSVVAGTDKEALDTPCGSLLSAKVEIVYWDHQAGREFCITLLRLTAEKEIPTSSILLF